MAETASPGSAETRELRRLHRERRRNTIGPVREDAESSINGALRSMVENHPAALANPQTELRVGCYVADDGEAAVDQTVTLLRDLGHVPALPQLVGDRMDFCTWAANDTLVPGRFDIPTPSNGDTVGAVELDLVLTPLVAFNRSCDRVGRGAGFYDRTFGPLQNNAGLPMLIGVAFEHQLDESIPVLAHDVPMDGVVTELGVRWRSTSSLPPSRDPGFPTARNMACE